MEVLWDVLGYHGIWVIEPTISDGFVSKLGLASNLGPSNAEKMTVSKFQHVSTIKMITYPLRQTHVMNQAVPVLVRRGSNPAYDFSSESLPPAIQLGNVKSSPWFMNIYEAQ